VAQDQTRRWEYCSEPQFGHARKDSACSAIAALVTGDWLGLMRTKTVTMPECKSTLVDGTRLRANCRGMRQE
jgi:hypothetical protein